MAGRLRCSFRTRLGLGVFLALSSWALTWFLPGARSHVLFFPLWFGYTLTVDALVEVRRGPSLLSRAPAAFSSLFVVSVPIWWFFELLNRATGNWEYLGSDSLGAAEYAFWASLNFSTVVPAVFETAELVASFNEGGRPDRPPSSEFGRAAELGLFATGIVMLVALLRWPRVLYPLVWIFPIFVFDPLAHAAGRPSLLRAIERGATRIFGTLAAAALICGFHWELWNYYSYPKWIYHVPGLDFARVFEMPLLGYLGYIPFGLALYSMSQLLLGRASELRI